MAANSRWGTLKADRLVLMRFQQALEKVNKQQSRCGKPVEPQYKIVDKILAEWTARHKDIPE